MPVIATLRAFLIKDEENKPNPRLRFLRYLLLVCSIFGSLYIVTFTFRAMICYSLDGAEYYTLADAMAKGQGYRMLTWPTQPVNVFCPIGLPLLTVPFCILYPGNMIAPHAIQVFFYLFAFASIFLLIERKSNWVFAFVVAATMAFNYTVYTAINSFLTDVPYLVLGSFLLYLVIAERTFESKARTWIFFIGFAFAILLREVSLVLIPITFLALLLKKKYQYAIMAVVIAVLLKVTYRFWVNQQFFVYSTSFGVPYATCSNGMIKDQFPNTSFLVAHIKMMMINFAGYFKLTQLYISSKTINYMGHPALTFLNKTYFIPLFLIGLAHQIRRRNLVIEIFFFMYLGIICVYPAITNRYLLPILPLIYLYTIDGAYCLGTLSYNGLKRWGVIKYASFAAILLLTPLFYYFHDQSGDFGIYKRETFKIRQGAMGVYTMGHGTYVESAHYLRSIHKPYENNIAVQSNPLLYSVLSNQMSSTIPLSEIKNYPMLIAYLKKYKINYFIVRRLGKVYEPPFIANFVNEMPKELSLKRQFNEKDKDYYTQIWEWKKPASTPTSATLTMS